MGEWAQICEILEFVKTCEASETNLEKELTNSITSLSFVFKKRKDDFVSTSYKQTVSLLQILCWLKGGTQGKIRVNLKNSFAYI